MVKLALTTMQLHGRLIMDKQQVYVGREEVDLDTIFNGKNVADMLHSVQKMAQEMTEYARPEFTIKFTTGYAGYDGGMVVYAEFWREETDQEYKLRIDAIKAKEEKARLKQEAKNAKALAKVLADEEAERALYEKLHAKFGQI